MRECFGQRFDVPLGYLNTTSIGIPPRIGAEAAHEVVDGWASGRFQAGDFDAAVDTAREGFAEIVGVPSDRVAIGATVSQLVASVAASLPKRARVLVREGEFTSATFPFVAQDHVVTEAPEERFLSEVDGHDLVVVSLVRSQDGRVLELEELRAAAERAGARVLLDVTQAAGWLPLRLDWADYVVCAGYKWLMCPRGVAWLAAREPETMATPQANWYAGEQRWSSLYGLPPRLATDARRLDLSPVWFSQWSAAVVLPWLARLDLTEVAAHNIGLANRLREGLGLPPADTAVVAAELDERAGERLAEAGVRAAGRGGRTRFAFHLYNTEDDVTAALEAIGAGE